MGRETSRRHGSRSYFLLLWPGWYARSHHLWQCTVPTYGNYATPEALYRVGADIVNLRLAFLTTLTLYSSQYFTSRNGRLLKWKQLPNHRMEVRSEPWSKLVPLLVVTHIT
jgi:hypothetical protein